MVKLQETRLFIACTSTQPLKVDTGSVISRRMQLLAEANNKRHALDTAGCREDRSSLAKMSHVRQPPVHGILPAARCAHHVGPRGQN